MFFVVISQEDKFCAFNWTDAVIDLLR